MRPGHESVKPSQGTNQFMAGTQIKMVGVAENNLGAEEFRDPAGSALSPWPLFPRA